MSAVEMPADAFSAFLTLESVWKVRVGMVERSIVVRYTAACKHELITLDTDDAE